MKNGNSRRWRATVTVMGLVPIALMVPVFLPSAQAAPAAGKSAKVVQVVDRSPVGEMLANDQGLSLYIKPSGSCTGSCESIWPPLLMPKGKTLPKGTSCLGTVAGPTKGRLQVTYDSQRLYTFVDDSGTSVNGNGVAGFEAAAVVTSCSS